MDQIVREVFVVLDSEELMIPGEGAVPGAAGPFCIELVTLQGQYLLVVVGEIEIEVFRGETELVSDGLVVLFECTGAGEVDGIGIVVGDMAYLRRVPVFGEIGQGGGEIDMAGAPACHEGAELYRRSAIAESNGHRVLAFSQWIEIDELLGEIRQGLVLFGEKAVQRSLELC